MALSTYQQPGLYPGSGQARLLNANHQYFALQDQLAVAGQASVAFQLERQKSAAYPFGYSVEVTFSGAPGTFEVDLQHADTDTDASYVTQAALSAVNSSNVARYEMAVCFTKFVRILVKTITNAVNITVEVSR